MDRSQDDLKDSALWVALQTMIAELTTTGEISVNTAPAYVIAYLCQELRAKNLVNESALHRRKG